MNFPISKKLGIVHDQAALLFPWAAFQCIFSGFQIQISLLQQYTRAIRSIRIHPLLHLKHILFQSSALGGSGGRIERCRHL